MSTLPELRQLIDGIDNEILSLLEQRARIAEEVAVTKRASGATTFHDPERERQVLQRLCARGAGRFPKETIRSVFREIMSGCLSLEEPLRIAYLGPEATHAHMAARHLFGLAARYHDATTVEAVFDAVVRGEASYGVVAVEDSREGLATGTIDALVEGQVYIRQELILPSAQCLLGHARDLSQIERLYAHSQPLGQCRNWVMRYLPGAQIIQATSTGAAVREASADPKAAAIASRLASEMHSIPVLRECIQDRPENATRFVAVALIDAPRTGVDKTTVAFWLPDPNERGALRRALEVLDGSGINLRRIESRPSGGKAWEYVFVADVEGHREDEQLGLAIDRLKALCQRVKVLGSYPRYVSPSQEEDHGPP